MTQSIFQAQPFELPFDPRTTALVMIDMQRDFVEAGGFGRLLPQQRDRRRDAFSCRTYGGQAVMVPVRPLFRTVFYLPTIVPAVASSIVWMMLFAKKLFLNQELNKGRDSGNIRIERIQDGSFAHEFMEDSKNGQAWLKEQRMEHGNAQIEEVGANIRSMFSFVRR